jgi:hypothetical protein
MGGGGNEDRALAPAQPGAYVLGHRLAQERFVLVDLDEMVAVAGMVEELGQLLFCFMAVLMDPF